MLEGSIFVVYDLLKILFLMPLGNFTLRPCSVQIGKDVYIQYDTDYGALICKCKCSNNEEQDKERQCGTSTITGHRQLEYCYERPKRVSDLLRTGPTVSDKVGSE